MDKTIIPEDAALALHEIGFDLPAREDEPNGEKTVRSSPKKKLITTIDLTPSSCRWPFGDPAKPDFHYCGKPSQPNLPYCDTHETMSRPGSQRKIRPPVAIS